MSLKNTNVKLNSLAFWNSEAVSKSMSGTQRVHRELTLRDFSHVEGLLLGRNFLSPIQGGRHFKSMWRTLFIFLIIAFVVENIYCAFSQTSTCCAGLNKNPYTFPRLGSENRREQNFARKKGFCCEKEKKRSTHAIKTSYFVLVFPLSLSLNLCRGQFFLVLRELQSW